MRIAVMGAGALGGYFGGRLAAAKHEVVLIARGAHLAAIRERGLKILSPRGNLHVPEIVVGSDAGKLFAWQADGSEVNGFPVDLGYELWASPTVLDGPRIAIGGLFIVGFPGCSGPDLEGEHSEHF